MNQKPFTHFTVPFGISARPFFFVSNAAALLDRKLPVPWHRRSLLQGKRWSRLRPHGRELAHLANLAPGAALIPSAERLLF